MLFYNPYMFTLTFVLGILLFRTIEYCRILYLNLVHASDPLMTQKLDGPDQQKIFEKADNEYAYWTFIVLPITLTAFVLNTTIWYYINWIGHPNYTLLYTSVVIITTALTIGIRSDPYPDWLYKWIIVLSNTQQQICIELLQKRLTEIRIQLQDVKNGKPLSETELYQLKQEGLMLSKEAYILTNNMKEAQEVQDLLD